MVEVSFFWVEHPSTQAPKHPRIFCDPSHVKTSEESVLKKLSLIVGTVFVFVTFFSMSSQAFAANVKDPSCDGDPYNNDFLVHDFAISSPDSNIAGEVSSILGRGLVCGTAIDDLIESSNPFGPHFGHGCGAAGFNPPEGEESLTERAVIDVPPGAGINPTSGMGHGSFAGTAIINVASCFTRSIAADQAAITRVEDNDGDDDCPDDIDIKACFRSDSALGFNYEWTRQTSANPPRYSLTIGPVHPIAGVAGVTHIKDFTLCAYSGAVGADSCGTSSTPDRWLQKNGDAAAPDCNGGQGPEGLYKVTIFNKRGDQTPDTPGSRACSPWEPPEPTTTVDPDCDGTPFDNTHAINRFLASTDPTTPEAVSSLDLSGLVCSTEIGASSEGTDTITDHVDFRIQSSVWKNTSIGGGLPEGAYVGSLGGRLAYHDANEDPVIEQTSAKITADDLGLRWLGHPNIGPEDNCNREADNPASGQPGHVAGRGIVGFNVGGDDDDGDGSVWDSGEIFSAIFTCFKVTGTTDSGVNWHAWLWKTVTPGTNSNCNPQCGDDGGHFLTLGPIYVNDDSPPHGPNDPESGPPAGLTDIGSLTLCKYANVSADECMDSGPDALKVHQNGLESACGRYSAVATRRDGNSTAGFLSDDEAESCVNWQGRGGERSSPGGDSPSSKDLGKILPSGAKASGDDTGASSGSSSGSKDGSRHGGTKSRRF